MSKKQQLSIALGLVRSAYQALKDADELVSRAIVEPRAGDLSEAATYARRMTLKLLTRLQSDVELDDLPDESASAQLLTLAAYFQDDYTRKLPVVAAFRRWRNGSLTSEALLKRLGEDDLAPVLHHDPVPPMEGLTILNDYRSRSR